MQNIALMLEIYVSLSPSSKEREWDKNDSANMAIKSQGFLLKNGKIIIDKQPNRFIN